MKLIAILGILTSLMSSSAGAAGAKSMVEAGEILSAKLTSQVVENGKKGIVLQLIKANGEVAQSIVMKSASKAELNAFLPSNLSKTLQVQKGAAKGFSFKALVAGKAMQFPVEAIGFYAALGAVMSFDLWWNSAKNPVGFDQLNQSQIDPVGQLGFYFFMLGNGATAEPLSQMIQDGKLNPKYSKYIPFLGMGMGSIASNIVHEIGDAANLRACSWSLVTTGKAIPACDEAAATWNDKGGILGVIDNNIPSFLGLAGSIVISGVTQSTVNSALSFTKSVLVKNGILEITLKANVKMGIEQIIKVAGVEIITSAIPGKLFFKLGKKLGAIAFNGAVFTFANKIEAPISYVWKTGSISDEIHDLSKQLDNDIRTLSQPKGSSLITTDHIAHIKYLGKIMQKWKEFNLHEVMEARGNWEQYLSKLIISYQSAKDFYSDFLGHQWQRKYGQFSSQYENGTYNEYSEEIFPLNGVKSTDLPSPDNEIIVTAPDQVEIAKMKTVSKVVSDIKKKAVPNLSAEEKIVYDQIIAGLEQSNPLAVGKTLEKMNSIISANGGLRTDDFKNCLNDRGCGPTPNALQNRLSEISIALGRPKPLLIKGRGYAAYYATLANNIAQVKKTDFPKRYSKSILDAYIVNTETYAESMLAAMLLGPDFQTESVIYLKNGFAADFRAPKIIEDKKFSFSFQAYPGMRSTPQFDIFSSPVLNDAGNKFNSGFSYLTQAQNSIETEVLNDDPDSYSVWWENYIEKKYLAAWEDFSKKYQVIVGKLISQIKSNDDSIFNLSSAKPGILASMNYENNYYYRILSMVSLQNQPQLKVIPQLQELKAASGAVIALMNKISIASGPLAVSTASPEEVDATYNRFAIAFNQTAKFFDIYKDTEVTSKTSFNAGQKQLVYFALTQLRDNLTQVRNYLEIATTASLQSRLNKEGKVDGRCVEAVEKTNLAQGANQIQQRVACQK